MLFNFNLGGEDYEMDLSPELRVEIVRHLLNLHKEYLSANPDENIDFESYLKLVEKSPHPENVAPLEDEDSIENDLIAYGAELENVKRKDAMIDGLLDLLGKLK